MQWQFLSRDEGEVDTLHDPSWTEDQGNSNIISSIYSLLYIYCIYMTKILKYIVRSIIKQQCNKIVLM